jgi:hypothetical protein
MELGLREGDEGRSVVLYALRLWAAVCLALFVAFWLGSTIPFGRVPPQQLCASCNQLRCAGLVRMIGTWSAPRDRG